MKIGSLLLKQSGKWDKNLFKKNSCVKKLNEAIFLKKRFDLKLVKLKTGFMTRIL